MNFDRLRQLLIQKALEGKLVTQKNTEKTSFINDKFSISAPFDIPTNWAFVPLTLLLDKQPQNGKSLKASGNTMGVRVLTLSATTSGSFKDTCFKFADTPSPFNKGWLLKNKDILIQRSNTPEYVGTACLFTGRNDEFIFPDLMIRIAANEKLLSPEFLVFIINSYYGKSYFQSHASGTSQSMPKINQGVIKAFLVPLPPLEEQHRIVARLNELLAIIKQAEDAHTDLQSLGKTLRERILQKAIEGKLVPQLDEESAVEQIGEAPAETPFAIPHKWRWEYLQTVSTIVAGQSPKGESLNEASKGMEFHQGKTDFSDRIIGVSKKFTTEPMKIAAANSVLMSVRAPVGDVNLTDRQLCIGRGLFSVLPQENIDLEFLFAYLQTTKKHLESLATGTTFKAINGKVVRQIAIPVPPLAEQHRIVAKLNELLPLIDQMTAV